ncbi:hypothetical protein BpHYR1_010669 [Brachionus plicatilis]|uniref:Uncharacterized protein n=1 Tax=Brachionus plicatilis TaxID=10195 RepID=A0A3M7PHF4_BRAPC|nr:hypothetical protein BpHYR1_010669 [Brachionus plicatilis]
MPKKAQSNDAASPSENASKKQSLNLYVIKSSLKSFIFKYLSKNILTEDLFVKSGDEIEKIYALLSNNTICFFILATLIFQYSHCADTFEARNGRLYDANGVEFLMRGFQIVLDHHKFKIHITRLDFDFMTLD